MADTVKEHVATSEECKRLLPENLSHVWRGVDEFEPVFMVDEETGKIERGSMIDTKRSLYFTFEVFDTPLTDGYIVPTSDWMLCPTD